MLSKQEWDDMDFWRSGENQVVQERLNDMDKMRKQGDDRGWYNPLRSDMYAAFDQTPLSKVKVAIFGQDPYPEPKYCTGVAFSVPEGIRKFPPTLANIFKEYSDDLHLTTPSSGDLTPWCEQGVFLWNVTPILTKGYLPHAKDWPEWEDLNREIVTLLSSKSIVFVFLGRRARELEKYVVDGKNSRVISTSHPSPLGVTAGRNPFFGSRLFSSINGYLNEINNEVIDWRLKGSRTITKTK